MIREIKFRGKNGKGEWVVGDLLHNRGETFIAPPGIADPLATVDDFRVNPDTVGQYTGMKDKYSTEVYEGDIMDVDGEPESIYWDEEYLQYFAMNQYGGSEPLHIGFKPFEIIGNIHENPELMK